LARPNILIFIPAVILWVVWLARRRNERLPYAIVIIAFLAGTAVAILPATIRNYVVAKEPVLICSNGGINLFLGNNPAADGYTPAAPSIRRWSCFDYPAIVQSLGKSVGRRLNYSEASEFFAREAVNYIKNHPGDFMKLTLKKALLFWGPIEIGNEKEDELERANSKILRMLPGNFSIVLSLALVGLLMQLGLTKQSKVHDICRRRNEATLLIVVFVILYFASYLPFFVTGRYRVPIIPFLLLFASYAISKTIRMLASHSWQSAAGWLLIWLALYKLASHNFAGYEPNLAKWHFDRGVRYERTNYIEDSIREYREAIMVKPNYADAHYNLGVVLARQGKVADALREFEETVRIRPTYAEAHFNKGIALAKLGKPKEAVKALEQATYLVPDDYMAYYVLGNLFANLGQMEKAIECLKKTLNLRRDYAEAHASLAQILYESGQYVEAWKEVELARRYGLEPPSDFLRELSEKLQNVSTRK
ncbi:MAG: tetratricopeptide repeat protein, partial [Armatimonadota bacterium]|nr:tetratricopeptide repeat protein [Armatimonadota bacterium]